MAIPPERRCLPLEVEGISLHREPRPLRRRGRARPRRSLRARVAAIVRTATGRSRVTPQ